MVDVKLYNGDCIEVMKDLRDECMDMTFTSPPYYNAREYSEYDDYGTYLTFLRDVFTEVYRITKEGRFVIVNTSPVIIARKNRSSQSRRLPISFDLNSIMMNIGFDFIDDIIWVKPNASVPNRNGVFNQCRKPLTYKPNIVTEYIMVYRKHTDRLIDWNLKQCPKDDMRQSVVDGNYDLTNVWNITPKHSKQHPAVFPNELSDRIVKYYSFVNDTVFDPFMGIGTTGESCINLDRNFIGVELERKYFKFAKRKLGDLLYGKKKLF